MDTVSLQTAAIPQQDTVALSVEAPVQTITEPVARERAARASFAMSSYGDTYDQWYAQLSAGHEVPARDEAARKVDNRAELRRQQAIGEYLKLRGPGGPLTPEEMQHINFALTPNKSADPQTVIEMGFATEWMKGTDMMSPDSWNELQRDFYKEFPQEMEQHKSKVIGASAKREFFKAGMQLAEENYNKQSWGGFLVDVAKTAAVPYTDIKLRGNEKAGMTGFEGFTYPGALDAERKALYSMPFEEAKVAYQTKLAKLMNDNPALAKTYAEYMLGKSYNEQGWDMLFSGLDLTTAGSILTIPIKHVAKKQIARNYLNQMAKEADRWNAEWNRGIPITAQAKEAAGNLGEAAVEKVQTRLTSAGTSSTGKQMEQDLPTILRSDMAEMGKDVTPVSRELTLQLEQDAIRHLNAVQKTVGATATVERIPELLNLGKAELLKLKEGLKDVYVGLPGKILDFSGIYREPNAIGYSIDVRIGKPGAELFKSYTEANNYAKAYKLQGYKLEQKGLGWFISVNRPIDENLPLIKNLMAKTGIDKDPDNQSTFGWFKDMITGWRTPEETLSLTHNINRKIATYAPGALRDMMTQEVKLIKDLARGVISRDPETGRIEKTLNWNIKNRWQEWNSIVKLARTMRDPDTGEAGYWFKNVGELQESYIRHLHRTADDAEVRAYFAYKRFLSTDWTLRNQELYKLKHSAGAQTHTFYVTAEDGTRIAVPAFDGTMVRSLPGSDATLLILGKSLGKEQLVSADRLGSTIREKLKKGIEEGKYKVVKLYNSTERPLRGFGNVENHKVQYVIGEVVESNALSTNQLPRRGGGHWEYDYDFYIKQARIVPESIGSKENRVFRNWYEGDTTIMPIQLRQMGADVAKHLDHIRTLLRDRELVRGKGQWEGKKAKLDEAREYAEKHLPISFDEIHKWFQASVVDGKKHPPRLSLTEPIQVVRKGETIGGVDKTLANRYRTQNADGTFTDTFKDGTKTGSVHIQNSVEFATQRDSEEFMTLVDNGKGTRYNPLYDYEPAQMVDPIPSIDRAMTRMVNSTYMNDYKSYAVNRWLEQNMQYLRATPEEVRGSPYWYFHNLDFVPNIPKNVKDRIEGTHWQIQQFNGVANSWDARIQAAGQVLADSIYGATGSARLAVVPQAALGSIADGVTLLRKATFTTAMGFFNPAQLLVQMNTFAVIAGVSGYQHAAAGSAGAFFSMLHKINRNPGVIDHFDKLMSSGGLPFAKKWKAGEFKESLEEMSKTGFDRVTGSYAMIDDALGPRVVSNAWGDFLHAGEVFFRSGEAAVRYGAWHTAYREFRDTKPIGRLTDADRASILQRADLLTVNMSRASNSAMHTGILSIPTQFLTYAMRMGELMLGKRITGVEKARILAWQAGLYGVPTSVGVYGFPFSDMIRSYALENGYQVGEDWMEHMVMEGLPSTIGRLVTGNTYNVGERYGTPGVEWVRDLWSDDKFWKTVFGAAGSKLSNTWANSSGFRRSMWQIAVGDPDGHKMTLKDFTDIFNEITTKSSIDGFIMAAKTGELMSRKENVLEEDVAWYNALFMKLTGLSPQGVPDAYQKSQSIKNLEKHEKAVGEKIIQNIRRGLRADADGNSELAETYYARAQHWKNLDSVNTDRMSQYIARAARNNETLIEMIDKNFYTKSLPDSQRGVRDRAWPPKE